MELPSGASFRLSARDAVLQALGAQLPFLKEQLLLVDSPHDGLPPDRYEGGRVVEHPESQGRRAETEDMRALWQIDPLGFHGLGGEPVAGPISGSYLAGPTVLPALGAEGCLLAAVQAAARVTQADRRGAKVRQHLWGRLSKGT